MIRCCRLGDATLSGCKSPLIDWLIGWLTEWCVLSLCASWLGGVARPSACPLARPCSKSAFPPASHKHSPSVVRASVLASLACVCRLLTLRFPLYTWTWGSFFVLCLSVAGLRVYQVIFWSNIFKTPHMIWPSCMLVIAKWSVKCRESLIKKHQNFIYTCTINIFDWNIFKSYATCGSVVEALFKIST